MLPPNHSPKKRAIPTIIHPPDKNTKPREGLINLKPQEKNRGRERSEIELTKVGHVTPIRGRNPINFCRWFPPLFFFFLKISSGFHPLKTDSYYMELSFCCSQLNKKTDILALIFSKFCTTDSYYYDLPTVINDTLASRTFISTVWSLILLRSQQRKLAFGIVWFFNHDVHELNGGDDQ